MKYKYLKVFYVGGINLPKDKEEITLKNDTNDSQIILTTSLDNHSFIFDRRNVIANLMLNAMFGGANPNPLSEKIDEGLKLMQEDRKRKFGKGVFLLFEFSGITNVELTEPVRDCGDYIITFDATDKNIIKDQYKSEINQVITSLFLVSKSDFNLKDVTDGIYLLNDDEKIIYSFTFSGTMNPTVSSPLDENSINKLFEFVNTKSRDIDFESINRLATQASIEHKDNLRAFLFTWTALEIFVHKAFKVYEQKFIEENTSDYMSVTAKKFFDRLQEVMKDKYRLQEKFIAIASLLSNESDIDLNEFMAIKKVRDNLTHGKEFKENELPTEKLTILLKKYLMLHLEYGNQSNSVG